MGDALKKKLHKYSSYGVKNSFDASKKNIVNAKLDFCQILEVPISEYFQNS